MGSKWAKVCSKGPERPQRGSEMPQNASQWPKMDQNGSKWVKMAQNRVSSALEGYRAPKEGWLKGAPKEGWLKEAPKGIKIGPQKQLAVQKQRGSKRYGPPCA